ncbi:MAG: 50S ribosomal protein L3 [Planctomycetes bacterium]|nr:50S ribosomal protein L3 [Planctomycetota bacterium]
MTKFILGRKGRMSQMYTEAGEVVPVTILEVGPCYVTRVLSVDSDGYDAIQVGYEKTREKVLSKAEVGHCKKAGLEPLRHLRELRLKAPAELAVGAEIKADVFEVGDMVDVVGTTKGRGFAGGIKRYGFGGGPMTHGGMCRRFPGSLGAGSDPGRVFKGKRAPGHYGDARFTMKNLKVVGIDVEHNLLIVKGAVPGASGGLIQVCRAKTAKIKASS